MRVMSIGKLAKSASVGIDTIRFYEKQGLLPQPERRESGYRQYTVSDARRLIFIRRAKQLGFSLVDISELLQLRAQSRSSGSSIRCVRSLAGRKLSSVENKIAELTRIKIVLSELVNTCPGDGDADQCPILRAFDGEQGAPR
jgi:MerR family copper efflux transcriptional regulator